VHAAGCNTADSVSSNKAFSSGIIIQHDPLYLRKLVAVDNLFQQANKTCNNYIISFTKLGNQKGKCPACWPPVITNKIIVLNDMLVKVEDDEKRNKH